MLRFEAIAHNTAELRCGRMIEKFPEIASGWPASSSGSPPPWIVWTPDSSATTSSMSCPPASGWAPPGSAVSTSTNPACVTPCAPPWRWRQRQGGAQGVTHAGFVEVDTADPGGAQPDAGGQLIEDVVAEESGVHTIQGGGEPLDDAGQPDAISGNFSIILPQRNSAVLCAIASNRSTRSPYLCCGPP